jgi:hypothetical protein
MPQPNPKSSPDQYRAEVSQDMQALVAGERPRDARLRELGTGRLMLEGVVESVRLYRLYMEERAREEREKREREERREKGKRRRKREEAQRVRMKSVTAHQPSKYDHTAPPTASSNRSTEEDGHSQGRSTNRDSIGSFSSNFMNTYRHFKAEQDAGLRDRGLLEKYVDEWRGKGVSAGMEKEKRIDSGAESEDKRENNRERGRKTARRLKKSHGETPKVRAAPASDTAWSPEIGGVDSSVLWRPPVPSHSPPLPPPSEQQVPPPPVQQVPQSPLVATKRAAPPPAPPAPPAPPPPPPPPPGPRALSKVPIPPTTGDARDSLLSQIRGGAKLRRVQTPDTPSTATGRVIDTSEYEDAQHSRSVEEQEHAQAVEKKEREQEEYSGKSSSRQSEHTG